MPIVRWSPSWDPFEGMEELFNRLPSAYRSTDLDKGFVPAMDVYETKNAFVVETPLAGVKHEDVRVSVEHGVLTVEGETKRQHEIDEKNYYRKETRSGSFFRQVALPASVKEDKVSAEFENGVLKITCPKAEPRTSKKVPIKIAKKK